MVLTVRKLHKLVTQLMEVQFPIKSRARNRGASVTLEKADGFAECVAAPLYAVDSEPRNGEG